MSAHPLKFGLDTFGDIQKDESGNLLSAAQTLRFVIEQGQYADSLGIDRKSTRLNSSH